jgi:hypothetical protein
VSKGKQGPRLLSRLATPRFMFSKTRSHRAIAPSRHRNGQIAFVNFPRVPPLFLFVVLVALCFVLFPRRIRSITVINCGFQAALSAPHIILAQEYVAAGMAHPCLARRPQLGSTVVTHCSSMHYHTLRSNTLYAASHIASAFS